MSRLGEIAAVFTRLGFTAFGGPAAHLAMLDDELVERRKWLTRQHFLDLLGLTYLIPGPSSTQMTMHLGLERGGVAGMLVAGLGFIVPAALLTGALAWAYTEYGALPEVQPWLAGVHPAVLAVIVGALWKLGRQAASDWRTLTVAAVSGAAVAAGAGEIGTLVAGGVLGAVWLRALGGDSEKGAVRVLLLLATPREAWAAAGVAAAGAAFSLGKLGLFFLKIGAVLYGTGYVLIAFLEGGLVDEYGWLTREQLLDAVAAGQLTPGPLLTTATFIGYQLAGVHGAVVATVAIFLPSFFLVAAIHPLARRLREAPWAGAFLDAVGAVAIAMMAVVTIRLALGALTSWQAFAIALGAAAAVFVWRANAALVVLGGAAAGRLLFAL